MPLSKVPFQLSCSPFRDWKELWGFPRAISSPGWTTLILSACFHTKVLQLLVLQTIFMVSSGLIPHVDILMLGAPELDAALQVGCHRAEQRGRIPSLGLLPRCIPERHLCPLGCQGTSLSHVELLTHQHPQHVAPWAAQSILNPACICVWDCPFYTMFQHRGNWKRNLHKKQGLL